MNRSTILEPECVSDTRLVEQSLGGDREAFGQIVARYQSPVCALAYSACGSFTRSEDLAQEIFITAWQRLSQLKEPGKLKAWLFGITRNLIRKSFRQQTRNPLADAECLEDCLPAVPETSGPPELAMSKEEEAILWVVLQGLPATYREPMVLFYRQEESIATVAEVLGISEEGVRQRLSRGRAMLNERVARVVENGLRRSGPAKTFGLAVLAALPLANAQAAIAGGLAVAVKGGAVKGAGLLGTLGMAATTAGALAGAVAGIWGQIRNAGSPREREFLARTSWGFHAWIIVFGLTVSGLAWLNGNVIRLNCFRDALGWALVWLGLYGVAGAFSIWRTRRHRQIQMEEGTLRQAPAFYFWSGGDPARPGFKAITLGALSAVLFGPGGLLMMVLYAIGDRATAGGLGVLSLLGWSVSAWAIARNRQSANRVLMAVWCGLALATLGTINLRWNGWVHDPYARRMIWPASPDQFHLAPFYLNFLLVVFFGSIALFWWLKFYFLKTEHLKRDTKAGLATFVALILLGLLLRHWV